MYFRVSHLFFSAKNDGLSRQQNILDTPIEYLKGVGPKKAASLNTELQIYTFGDLLDYFPFRYIDKTKVYPIGDITSETPMVQLKGKLYNIKTAGEQRTTRLTATLGDDTGSIDLTWFKGIRYMKSTLKVGQEYLVFGKPRLFGYRFSISHPEMELVEENKEVTFNNRLVAVYPTTEKLKSQYLDSKGIQKLMKQLFEKLKEEDLTENLPNNIMQEYKMLSRWQAYRNIHLPEHEGMIPKAQFRLKFEEFFFIQIQSIQMKLFQRQKYEGYVFPELGKNFHGFFKQLPFELTDAQKRVLREIRRDTMNGKQMNRLLQGDVGSGKTIVGLMTMLIALDSEFQACLMAPTEILAQQHFESISTMLKGLDIRVDILTGSIKSKKTRRQIHDKLELGMTKILIGTHALIEDTVQFKNLGMVIIDEQHRFGVAQRAKMWTKNTFPPHVLVMTATPIPRTLAMTIYGDLDVSVIDELPPGRKPIQTFHFFESKRLYVFEFLKKEIAKGRQVYIVYPLINESETLDYKNLMEGYEAISRAFPLPKYKVSVVHGQMAAVDKEEEMLKFKNGETHIMVATTVIEVGVDVPNSSVMVIESAERFGLAQLHQLRGRVGRGAEQSYCILMTGQKLSEDGRTRMNTMVETNDGFRIAEVDMKLRGPGNMQGTQQSGVLNMKLADLTKDSKILNIAREAAIGLLNEDPNLEQGENVRIKRYMRYAEAKKESKWSRIS